jgi:hypothetical protein
LIGFIRKKQFIGPENKDNFGEKNRKNNHVYPNKNKIQLSDTIGTILEKLYSIVAVVS